MNYEQDRLYDEYTISMAGVEYTIPPRLLVGLNRHVTDGSDVDSFTQALPSNDLQAAVYQADPESRTNLPAFVVYLHWQVPGNCWGSPETVKAWREEKAKAADTKGVLR